MAECEFCRIFGEALFNPIEEPQRHHVWTHLPKHPLQVHFCTSMPSFQDHSYFFHDYFPQIELR